MPRVQDDEAQAREHVPVHPLDDLVGDLRVRRVPPPDEDVGARQHLLGQAVLGVVQRGGADGDAVAEVLDDPRGDRRVHAVRVDPRDVLLELLVAVLAPDEDAEGTGRFTGHGMDHLSSERVGVERSLT